MTRHLEREDFPRHRNRGNAISLGCQALVTDGAVVLAGRCESAVDPPVAPQVRY